MHSYTCNSSKYLTTHLAPVNCVTVVERSKSTKTYPYPMFPHNIVSQQLKKNKATFALSYFTTYQNIAML